MERGCDSVVENHEQIGFSRNSADPVAGPSNGHCHSSFAPKCRRLCVAHQCYRQNAVQHGDFAIDHTFWPAALLRVSTHSTGTS